ncbi:MAG: hypothetical protein E6G45_12670 [Actinobacteria bacterium]|nr:MAG: hypothetical protein E6G45_12670 [Actinomycetota bacterium]
MRWGMLTTVALAVALSACGGSKSSPIGWRTHHVDDGGFSIATPAAWRTIEKIDTGSIDEFTKENPKLAPFAGVLKGGLIKFLAIDPDVADDFATNANVLVHNVGVDMSFEEYVRQSVAATHRLDAVGVQSRVVRVPAGRSSRLSYGYDIRQNQKTKRLTILQYAFLRGGSEYVITFTTLPSLRERYRTTFARAARSFRFD